MKIERRFNPHQARMLEDQFCDEDSLRKREAVIESSVSGDSRKPPAADVMTTYCLPFLSIYVIGVA